MLPLLDQDRGENSLKNYFHNYANIAKRHEGVLSEAAVDEFRSAADTYRALLPSAR